MTECAYLLFLNEKKYVAFDEKKEGLDNASQSGSNLAGERQRQLKPRPGGNGNG